jgi:eukaryotic-like serine/threonine-protein kinase
LRYINVMTESETPTQLGPYRVLRRLGRGGMAEVFLAVSYGASGFEKKVALKTLLPELQGNAIFERMLIEEAKLGALFQHKNVLQVHELGLDDATYYVRLDYIEGISLSKLCARQRLPRDLALFIAQEIALGLHYIHNLHDEAGRPLGMVHRDISPGNVLISKHGEVKLSDFGTLKANLLSDVTWGKIVKGKYSYMSPEQIRSERLGVESDIFSVGVLLAELLTQSRPFDGETVLETMDNIKNARLLTFPELPNDLSALLQLCLALNKSDRFASAGALFHALQQVSNASSMMSLSHWISSLST